MTVDVLLVIAATEKKDRQPLNISNFVVDRVDCKKQDSQQVQDWGRLRVLIFVTPRPIAPANAQRPCLLRHIPGTRARAIERGDTPKHGKRRRFGLNCDLRM